MTATVIQAEMSSLAQPPRTQLNQVTRQKAEATLNLKSVNKVIFFSFFL